MLAFELRVELARQLAVGLKQTDPSIAVGRMPLRAAVRAGELTGEMDLSCWRRRRHTCTSKYSCPSKSCLRSVTVAQNDRNSYVSSQRIQAP